MTRKDRDEYYVLTEKLEEIGWALEGKCNDIDCDHYMYKELLKKRYRPVLEHNFSCMNKLKKEKEAIMGLLSIKKFKRFRYEKCNVCKRSLDKLSEKNKIVSFTKPLPEGGCQWDGVWAHRSCSRKVKAPKGWKRGF